MTRRECQKIATALANSNIPYDEMYGFFELDDRIITFYNEWQEFLGKKQEYTNMLDEITDQLCKAERGSLVYCLMQDKIKQSEIRNRAKVQFINEAVDTDEREQRQNYLNYNT